MPDLNSSFTVDNKDVILSNLRDQIVQALDRLLSTRVGSDPFNRNYGTHLYDLLFENSQSVDPVDVGLLLYRDITNLEPRISIDPYGVSVTKKGNHSVLIECTIYINDNSGSSFSYSVQLNEDA